MGFDLQPDGLTAGLAGHCQPDKKYPLSHREKGLQGKVTRKRPSVKRCDF